MIEKKSKVKDGKYIVIASFMLTELNLKGNELLIYAIIYGFSQTDGMKGFSGSLQYLADWTNSTKQGVIKNLKSLTDKGYITKKESVINGIKYCTYQTIDLDKLEGIKQSLTPCNNVEQGSKQSLMGYSTEFNGGIKQSLPNNIDIYTSDIIEDSIEPVEATPQAEPTTTPTKNIKEVKRKHGEYNHVLLTDKQYNSLVEKYGKTIIDGYITKIDEWIQLKGKSPYKDFNLAIQNWLKNDNVQPIQMASNYQNQNNGGWWG